MNATTCYACSSPAHGHALRDRDGGPARGDDAATTIAVPACRRHAWNPRQHPALDRLVPRPPLRLRPCTIKRAKVFVEAHHRHLPKLQGALFAAAVDQGHVRVGVVVVGRPKNRHLDDGDTCEVTRAAIDDSDSKAAEVTAAAVLAATVSAVRGGLAGPGFLADLIRALQTDRDRRAHPCSMLYGAARRAAKALGYSKIITYTRADESGVSLKGAGWVAVAEVDGESWDRDDRPREAAEVVDRVRWESNL